MAAGFQCWNDGNSLQIDGKNTNLMFLEKKTLTASTQGYFSEPNGGYTRTITYSFNAINPVVAIQCSAGVWLAASSINRSSPYNCSMDFEIYSTTSIPVTFYLFGEQASSGANYGMQVFDESGVLVFDAANKQFKVTGAHNPVGPVIFNDSTLISYNYSPGSDYAFVLTESIGSIFWDLNNQDPSNAPRAWLNMVWNSGTSILCQQRLFTVSGGASWPVNPNQGTGKLNGGILVLDVTNY